MTVRTDRSWMSALMVSVALLAGCGGQKDLNAGHASSTLAQYGDDVYAVNVDEGTVSRVARDGTVTTSARLGGEPTRIAATKDRLFVTLRADGELAVLNTRDLSVERRIPVGAEPYGVVTNSSGTRAYVAVSLEDKVLELQTSDGQILREFAIPHEPKWLALNPTETRLYVAAQRSGGEVSSIDLESGTIQTQSAPPTGGDHIPNDVDIDLPDPAEGGGTFVPGTFTPRSTGDIVVSPDGSTLAVPTLYVDNITPVTTVDDPQGGGGYGGDNGVSVGRVNPALVTFLLNEVGDLGEGIPLFLGVAPGRGVMSSRDVFRSYPNAVVSDPDSRYFAVSMEGSDAVIVVDTEPYPGQGRRQPRRNPTVINDIRAPSLFGFWERPTSLVVTEGSGPRGLAFVGNDLLVHTFLDRRVERVGWDEALAANSQESYDKEGISAPLRLRAASKVEELTKSALSPEVDRGRRLFLSARNPDMSVATGGISCATCHTDGRDDSVTWTFREGDGEVHLQTPSLAGPVNDTAPLTWRSPVETVADEALLTSTLRMGGRGASADDLLAIEAFVVNSRLPALPGQDQDMIAEGRALFERDDVKCASCHAGETLTDGKHYPIVDDLEANTPGLRGIAATAPYLHDGSMKNLRDVLVWARSGEMGDTSMLDDRQLDALEMYLRSL